MEEHACIAKLQSLASSSYRGAAFVEKYIDCTRCIHALVEKYAAISNADPVKSKINNLIDMHAAMSARFTEGLRKKQQARGGCAACGGKNKKKTGGCAECGGKNKKPAR